jgi:hypothetical protein
MKGTFLWMGGYAMTRAELARVLWGIRHVGNTGFAADLAFVLGAIETDDRTREQVARMLGGRFFS